VAQSIEGKSGRYDAAIIAADCRGSPMRRPILCTVLLLAAGLLAACGNKGPLVLPPAQPGSTVAPAVSAPAPAQSAPLPG
jgi:predicted small lipoprotein YifL